MTYVLVAGHMGVQPRLETPRKVTVLYEGSSHNDYTCVILPPEAVTCYYYKQHHNRWAGVSS